MSTTLTAPPTAASAATEEDAVFTIPGLSWEQYVAINDALGDQPNLRTLFLDGRLTFVSPAYVHEWSEDALDSILKAIVVGCEIELSVLGSTTLRTRAGATGLEGDRAYYLGANVARVGRPDRIELEVHPPPDLAIEVENTHKATDALVIYAQLGVPEVWRRDARSGTLTFGLLQPDGTYRPIAASHNFPFLTPEDLSLQLERAREIPSYTRWSAQLAAWVRDVILPRLKPA